MKRAFLWTVILTVVSVVAFAKPSATPSPKLVSYTCTSVGEYTSLDDTLIFNDEYQQVRFKSTDGVWRAHKQGYRYVMPLPTKDITAQLVLDTRTGEVKFNVASEDGVKSFPAANCKKT